jgi:hypothetical protein
MSCRSATPQSATPPAPRGGTLIDWLALLMLLAGSVVWPR